MEKDFIYTVTQMNDYIDGVEECVWYFVYASRAAAKASVEQVIKDRRLENGDDEELNPEWDDLRDYSLLKDYETYYCIVEAELI